eukprot:Nk52_evm2s250 gene=Nk52_evmTU2s250
MTVKLASSSGTTMAKKISSRKDICSNLSDHALGVNAAAQPYIAFAECYPWPRLTEPSSVALRDGLPKKIAFYDVCKLKGKSNGRFLFMTSSGCRAYECEVGEGKEVISGCINFEFSLAKNSMKELIKANIDMLRNSDATGGKVSGAAHFNGKGDNFGKPAPPLAVELVFPSFLHADFLKAELINQRAVKLQWSLSCLLWKKIASCASVSADLKGKEDELTQKYLQALGVYLFFQVELSENGGPYRTVGYTAVSDTEEKEMAFAEAKCSPGCEYLVQVRCGYSIVDVKEKLDPSEHVFKVLFGEPCKAYGFKTLPDVPDPPEEVSITGRKSHSCSLKWSKARANGMPVETYVLKYRPVKEPGIPFRECYRGIDTRYTVRSLLPSSGYVFIVYAINGIGESSETSELICWTIAAKPSVPDPPLCQQKASKSLLLAWKYPNDNGDAITAFTLEMLDPRKKDYGYKVIYSGEAVQYTVNNLEPRTEYCFRVNAGNLQGVSTFSVPLVVSTSAIPPLPPRNVRLLGHSSSRSCTIGWNPPLDDGGSPILEYRVVLKIFNSEEKTMYIGSETEFEVHDLPAGRAFEVRVFCTNCAGEGQSSCVVLSPSATEPLPPQQLLNVPEASSPNCLTFMWDIPNFDGGSKIVKYSVELSTDRRTYFICCEGQVRRAQVVSLFPGTQYFCRVRAFNEVGPGLYSDVIMCSTPSAAPGTPGFMKVESKSSTKIDLLWGNCDTNGAPLLHSIVEMAKMGEELVEFKSVFKGKEMKCSIKNLTPFTEYSFRVCCVNEVGPGPLTAPLIVKTSPTCPSVPEGVCVMNVAEHSVALSWDVPCDNGSVVTGYIVKCESNVSHWETQVKTSCNSAVIDMLEPACSYKMKVQALNSCGNSCFSPAMEVFTRGLPPSFVPNLHVALRASDRIKLNVTRPKLPGVKVGLHDYDLSVKWKRKSSETKYTNLHDGPFRGQLLLGDLSPNTHYIVQACFSNEYGQGPLRELLTSTTISAPKSPKLSVLWEEETSSTAKISLCWDADDFESGLFSFEIQKKEAHVKDSQFVWAIQNVTSSVAMIPLSSREGIYIFRARAVVVDGTDAVCSPFSSETVLEGLPRNILESDIIVGKDTSTRGADSIEGLGSRRRGKTKKNVVNNNDSGVKSSLASESESGPPNETEIARTALYIFVMMVAFSPLWISLKVSPLAYL